MCDFEVDLETIAPGVNFTAELSKLRRLQDEGLVTIEGTKLIVTEPGRPVVRVVAAAFDNFRQVQRVQFSPAV